MGHLAPPWEAAPEPGVQGLTARPPSPAAMDLIMWTDVKKSGVALGAATAVYVLFELSGLYALSVLSYLALAGVLGCFAWANVGPILGKEGVPVAAPQPDNIEAKVTALVSVVCPLAFFFSWTRVRTPLDRLGAGR